MSATIIRYDFKLAAKLRREKEKKERTRVHRKIGIVVPFNPIHFDRKKMEEDFGKRQ